MHEFLRHTLQGKVALISGAGSGIGRATAVRFGHAGARVAAVGPNRQDLEETCALVRQHGSEAVALVADVRETAQVAAAVNSAAEAFGGLDFVIANAGINGLWGAIEDFDPADWDETLDVNLRGTFFTIQQAVPLLKARPGGAVVIVSSVNGTRMFSSVGASAYATSKAGQLALGRMLALELAPAGIRVNTVCPGSTRTRIVASTRTKAAGTSLPPPVFPHGGVPLTNGGFAAPEQIADAVWFLCSPLAGHITGAELFVDGGESLLKG